MRAREAYRYACMQQKRLRLEDWHLCIHTHQADHVHPSFRDQGQVVMGGIACVTLDTLSADVHIGCYREDDDEVRETIRHELLHIRLAELEWTFEQALAGLGHEAAEILRGSWAAASERAVNAIAAAMGDGS